jgi:SAM-dependent methyltransferase
MDDFLLIYAGIDAHGPGSRSDSLAALRLVPEMPGSILDIGCGPGNATLALAEETRAHITALDNLGPSLQRLGERAEEKGLASRVTLVEARMDDMPFEHGAFDLIWSECSIYIMGFEKALRYWRRFLSDGGTMVVNDLVWTRENATKDIVDFWGEEYPDMKSLQARTDQVDALGFDLVATHTIAHESWATYYRPLSERVSEVRHQLADPGVADAVEQEVDVMKRQEAEGFNYVFFVLKPRRDD